jgi:hypothetical protein
MKNKAKKNKAKITVRPRRRRRRVRHDPPAIAPPPSIAYGPSGTFTAPIQVAIPDGGAINTRATAMLKVITNVYRLPNAERLAVLAAVVEFFNYPQQEDARP